MPQCGAAGVQMREEEEKRKKKEAEQRKEPCLPRWREEKRDAGRSASREFTTAVPSVCICRTTAAVACSESVWRRVFLLCPDVCLSFSR